ncbi:MAG: hypothetical protein C4539_17075 [Ignavibacteriales bacterium]|nr:MAG: hypothetical protein C4539_17075 [Ignavibacteriales bacterium]
MIEIKKCKKNEDKIMFIEIFKKRIIPLSGLLILICLLFQPQFSFGQVSVKTNWLAVGELNNFYSSIGCEIEIGRAGANQQDGMRWPGLYDYTDIQAAKALWIGTTNFVDENGENYDFKVVHVGPRATGVGEFTPMVFNTISKIDKPEVYADGILSERISSVVDEVDPTIPADRMIVNVCNTKTGITMTRKIMQWSQEFHDDYHIMEYTLKNTGNIDADDEIELPNKTLTGVYLYFQYRLAPCANTRYEIGNSTGWGTNTMIDTRGDGVKNDPDNPDGIRAQWVWHGPAPIFTAYDNLGGPLWTSAEFVSAGDTIGRLGAPQFAGVVTLHADKSATDHSDDPGQPSTTDYVGSDEPYTSFSSSEYDKVRMAGEYGWISRGHKSIRHCDKADPDGDFTTTAGVDPAMGRTDGYSFCNGYGPYTIGPGDSVVIVIAEAVNGLSRAKSIEHGRIYKREFESAGTNQTAKDAASLKKNTIVMTGKDSLLMTFRRAIDNYNSGYNITEAPLPPKVFNVTSGGDRIALTWDVYESDPNLKGFEIWRAVGRYDSNYTKIFDTDDISVRSYNDKEPQRGFSYYYYMVTKGPEITANSTLGIWKKQLVSNRYYSQSYDPANLKRQPGTSLSQVRIVPNPFHITSSLGDKLRFGEKEPNKLAFFNIPGECTIKIFTELGELIHTIEHTDGSGDHYWFQQTSSNQLIAPGVYIAIIEDTKTGDRSVEKFVVVR